MILLSFGTEKKLLQFFIIQTLNRRIHNLSRLITNEEAEKKLLFPSHGVNYGKTNSCYYYLLRDMDVVLD